MLHWRIGPGIRKDFCSKWVFLILQVVQWYIFLQVVLHLQVHWFSNAAKSHLEHKEIPPANIPYVLIGTGLLWFGWFGFNAGSALGANSLAVSALFTTNTAAAAAGLSWMFFDVLRGKKPSVLGFCIGAVVGLVAITPAAGFVAIPQSIIIGVVAAIISNIVVYYKQKSTLDDTLDVFPCHGVGGMVGMLMTGIFATKSVNGAGADGLWLGNAGFLLTQVKGMLIAVGYSFVMSFLIFKFINFLQPMRVTSEDEELGLDATQHNEKYLQGHLLVTQRQIRTYCNRNRKRHSIYILNF